MKGSSWLQTPLIVSSLFFPYVSGSNQGPIGISPRALAVSPNGYSPAKQSCQSSSVRIRTPHDISPEEAAWVKKRKQNVVKPMRDLLKRSNIPDFNSDAYMDKVASSDGNLPVIGIAMSGGGYRALLVGAGAMAAFDDRTTGSTQPGHIGGLLQASTYVSGLSGGGWLVGSLFVNNFTSVQDILAGEANGQTSIWNFGRSMLEGPKTRSIPGLSIVDYWKTVHDQVNGKKQAGFDLSITDYWARTLSFQMVNAPHGGPAYTWSSIADQPGFPDAQSPLPILVSCGRAPGELIVPRNTTVYEFSPWEMGSWDPTLFGMAPLKYVGSNFHAGSIRGDECVTGFDNAAFVMATSSSLFNAVVAKLVETHSSGILSSVTNWIRDLAQRLDSRDQDIASWTPNPFRGWNPSINKGADSRVLSLVDGGEDYQNIPLYPHIQPVRKVDVIFAVDSSADSGNMDGWPNGTALVATYERHQDAKTANGTTFPAIPDINSFSNLGLNTKPTFFGCDVKNLTGPSPLIVYIPNHPYTYYTNISTATSVIKDKERNAIIRNGYHVATMGNGTVDPDWPACVSCAILSRSFTRTGTTPPAMCQSCFQKHCWNGSLDPKKPAKYHPKLAMPKDADTDTNKDEPKGNNKKKNAAVSIPIEISAVLGVFVIMVCMLML